MCVRNSKDAEVTGAEKAWKRTGGGVRGRALRARHFAQTTKVEHTKKG